jgi:hypothetical protein
MTERLHWATTDEVIAIHSVDIERSRKSKPKGLWYEVDGDWECWCTSEEFRIDEFKFVHRVDLGVAKILRLTTPEMIDEFTFEFGIHPDWSGDARFFYEIDWPNVAEDFDGIEIAPYQWERRLELSTSWYYGWDCASGCIWSPAPDTSVTLIGERFMRQRASEDA